MLLVLGEQVVRGGPVTRLDRHVETLLVPHRLNGWVDAARWVTDLGWPTLVVPLLVPVVALVALRTRSWQLPLRVLGLLVGLAVTVVGLKHALGRPGPQGTVMHGGAWPSGHATTATVCWGAAVRALDPAGTRLRTALAVGVPGVVGVCLVVAGYHQVSDVLAGWALGALLLHLAGPLRRPGQRSGAGEDA